MSRNKGSSILVGQHADSPDLSSEYIPNTPAAHYKLLKALDEAYAADSHLAPAYASGIPKPIQRGPLYWVFYSSHGLAVAIAIAKVFVIALSDDYSIDLYTLRYHCLAGENSCVIELPLFNRVILLLLSLQAFVVPEVGVTFDPSIIKLTSGRQMSLSAEEFFKLDPCDYWIP